jgi:hypothetical protein
MQLIFLIFKNISPNFYITKLDNKTKIKTLHFEIFEIDKLNFYLINNIQKTKCYNTNTIILVEYIYLLKFEFTFCCSTKS